jgi:hypothetical protein
MAAGDHVYIYCGVYSHHGIDVGDGTVIHFESTPWQKMTGQAAVAEIRQVDAAVFSLGRPIYRRVYDRCSPLDVVVQRARSRIGESGYDLFFNNCEHFAVWCKTGRPYSTQVVSVVGSLRDAAQTVPLAWMLLRGARYFPRQTRVAVCGTAISLTAGTVVARYIRRRLDDILAGES